MNMRKYTDEEYKSIPHVVLTPEAPWDPSTQDFEADDQWFVHTPKATITSPNDVYDECGKHHFQANLATSFPCHICLLDIQADPDTLFQAEFDLDNMDDSSDDDMPSIGPLYPRR